MPLNVSVNVMQLVLRDDVLCQLPSWRRLPDIEPQPASYVGAPTQTAGAGDEQCAWW